jgi:hypothetical protein
MVQVSDEKTAPPPEFTDGTSAPIYEKHDASHIANAASPPTYPAGGDLAIPNVNPRTVHVFSSPLLS